MASKEEIDQFLQDFKFKTGFYDVAVVATKAKDRQTLLDLEITHAELVRILNRLEVADYSSGPVDEVVYMGAPMWFFGYVVKGTEVYIKISEGLAGNRTMCISFHTPKYPMDYPYKT